MVNEPRRRIDEYGPGEMAIPTWTLLQKTGGDWAKSLGGKEGQFFNKITDEITDELNIVVVDVLTGRAKWGSDISDAGPVCACMDAKSMRSIYYKGTDEEEGVGDCSGCPDRADAPWALDATERRTKCCLNYTILGIDLDHDYMPIMLRAHGTSALAVRQLITLLKMNRALRGEYYRAKVNIQCQEKTTPFGITYVIHPKIVELITDESKAKELQIESNRLLGAPLQLPEGRPDELETSPLGFLPDGTPFYSEEEKQKLLAAQTEKPPEEKQEETPPPPPAPPAQEKKTAEVAGKPAEEKVEKAKPAPAPEAKKPAGKEAAAIKEDLDLVF